MTIKLKKRYDKKNGPTERLDLDKLNRAISFYNSKLNIKDDVLISLKPKKHYLDNTIGVTFWNEEAKKISIHCFVHRHTVEKVMLLAIAHEMVHAKQMSEGRKVCEEEADTLGHSLCKEFIMSEDLVEDAGLLNRSLMLMRFFIN